MLIPDENEGKTGNPQAEVTDTATPTDASAGTEKTDTQSKENMIPQSRFNEVNEERKEYKQRVADLEEQIGELQEQMTEAQANSRTVAGTTEDADPQRVAFKKVYIDPTIEPLKAEISALKDELKATKEERAYNDQKAEINKRIEDLQKTYPEMRAKEVLVDFSRSKRATWDDLKDLARTSHESEKARIQTRIDAEFEAKKKDAKTKLASPRSVTPAATPAPRKFPERFEDSMMDAAKLAEKRLKDVASEE